MIFVSKIGLSIRPIVEDHVGLNFKEKNTQETCIPPPPHRVIIVIKPMIKGCSTTKKHTFTLKIIFLVSYSELYYYGVFTSIQK